MMDQTVEKFESIENIVDSQTKQIKVIRKSCQLKPDVDVDDFQNKFSKFDKKIEAQTNQLKVLDS